MNVVDYLMESKTASDIALLTPIGDYSYEDLQRAVDATARFLLNSGVREGDRILLLAENSFFWVASYLGTLRAGCVAVPIAPSITKEDIRYIVESCSILAAFIHYRVTLEQLGALPAGSIVVSDEKIMSPGNLKHKFVTFGELLDTPDSKDVVWPEIDERKDLAAIMFTSGSTGKPRGVMVSHRNIIANTSSIVQYLALTANDRVMVVLPFYYCFGTSLLHTHLRTGGSLVLDPRFMFPDKVLVRMQETRCSGFAGVPSHFQMLLRKSSFTKMRFPFLRYVQQAGGKLASALIEELREAVGPSTSVFIMYGQTEATARLSYLPPTLLDKKMGSIGKGIPGTQLKVIDEHGQEVLPGQVGEIVAEGDNVTLGYWDAKEDSALTFRDGYLRTGDLATVDDEGYIFIVDRSKDFIKCAGRRVSCREIEDAILKFEGLIEVAVVGVPDDLLGEAIKLFIVPQTLSGDLVDRLQGFCSQRFPSHLIPKEIVVLSELPKNSAGKIMKSTLRLRPIDSASR
jgi:long-chain acyl-CoA synthetase